jgi:hypothetical protein
MNITREQLIQCIEKSMYQPKFLVESTSFYSCKGDTEVTYDYVVNPHILIEELNKLDTEELYE